MDAISKLEDNEISKVIAPTFAAFVPLLEAKRAHIKHIPAKTFTYGPTPRHQLDVYYPPSPTSGTAPVLFFVYGGGFTTGERTLPPPTDLMYANVASYFARQGFITVIPDYRLVPHVKFPGQPEDVRDALKWVIETLNPATEGSSLPKADLNSIFMMGQSAGAAHVAVMMLYPGLTPPELSSHVKGIVLISGAYSNFPAGLKGDFADLFGVYWADEDEARKNDPLPLLNNLSNQDAAGLPPILLVEGSREPEWLLVVGSDFFTAARQKSGVKVEKVVAEGHNHVSITTALSTGQGEEWAARSVEWMKNILN